MNQPCSKTAGSIKKINLFFIVIPACRESFFFLKKDSGQARMTEQGNPVARLQEYQVQFIWRE